MYHITLFLKVIIVLVLLGVTISHVTLTYPWPRKYALDFLDVIRTPGPCGMSKGIYLYVFKNIEFKIT